MSFEILTSTVYTIDFYAHTKSNTDCGKTLGVSQKNSLYRAIARMHRVRVHIM